MIYTTLPITKHPLNLIPSSHVRGRDPARRFQNIFDRCGVYGVQMHSRALGSILVQRARWYVCLSMQSLDSSLGRD